MQIELLICYKIVSYKIYYIKVNEAGNALLTSVVDPIALVRISETLTREFLLALSIALLAGPESSLPSHWKDPSPSMVILKLCTLKGKSKSKSAPNVAVTTEFFNSALVTVSGFLLSKLPKGVG